MHGHEYSACVRVRGTLPPTAKARRVDNDQTRAADHPECELNPSITAGQHTSRAALDEVDGFGPKPNQPGPVQDARFVKFEELG